MATIIDFKGIHLEDRLIPTESQEWGEWLMTAKSFRFEITLETWIDGRVPVMEVQTFTGVKLSKGYWQAQKRVNGTLRREHLGRHLNYQMLK